MLAMVKFANKCSKAKAKPLRDVTAITVTFVGDLVVNDVGAINVIFVGAIKATLVGAITGGGG